MKRFNQLIDFFKRILSAKFPSESDQYTEEGQREVTVELVATHKIEQGSGGDDSTARRLVLSQLTRQAVNYCQVSIVEDETHTHYKGTLVVIDKRRRGKRG